MGRASWRARKAAQGAAVIDDSLVEGEQDTEIEATSKYL